MNARIVLAGVAVLGLAGCLPRDRLDCEITLRLPEALSAVPEGYVREVPLHCGPNTVSPDNGMVDRLESTDPAVATVAATWWNNTSNRGDIPHDAYYLLAHAPGRCQLRAFRDGFLVAEFDVEVVEQDAE